MAGADRGRGKNEGGVDPREAATGKVSVAKFACKCFVENVSASNRTANSSQIFSEMHSSYMVILCIF